MKSARMRESGLLIAAILDSRERLRQARIAWLARLYFSITNSRIIPTSACVRLALFADAPDSTGISHVSLMQDRQYREAVAWQNTAYNQPPHPGFAMAG